MRNMPSIDKGQKRSSASHIGSSRSETWMASTNVEQMARLSATVSARRKNRDSRRPSPRARVRQSTRSRHSRPIWKAPDPMPNATASMPVISGAVPVNTITPAHIRAPTESIRPCQRKGWSGVVGAAGRTQVRTSGGGSLGDGHDELLGWWRAEPLAAAPDDQNDPAGPDPGHREPGPVSGPRLKSRPGRGR